MFRPMIAVTLSSAVLTLAATAAADPVITPSPDPAPPPAAVPIYTAPPAYAPLPLPVLPAPAPAAEKPEAKPPIASLPGPTLDVRLGILAPTGKTFDGTNDMANMSSFGIGATEQVTFGWFFSKSAGLLGGVRVSQFHKGADGYCPPGSGGCSGSTLQIPLMVRYAPEGRGEGFFFEGGLGLLTRYAITIKASDGEGTARFSNDLLEAKLGAGYRVLTGSDRSTARGGIEIFAAADIGQFQRLDITVPGKSAGAEITNGATHLTFTAGIGGYFLP